MQFPRSIRLSRLLGATLSLLSVAACSDELPTSAPSIADVRGPRFDVAAAANGAPLVSATGTGCLSVQAGSTSAGVAVTVAPCVPGADYQTWTLPPVGSTGLATVGGGTTCLDAWGGKGAPGTQLGTWGCVATAPNHQWTLTTEGYLKGQNGLCATASGAGGSVTLQACSGASNQQWTTTATTPTTPTTTTSAPLVSGTGAGCLAVANGSTSSAASVTLATCATGSAAQSWTLPGVGSTGLATVGGATMCLDAWGGNGTPGTQLGTWSCVATAPNHQWTLTSDGYLKGQNGLCATASGAGGSVTLQPCTGASNQQWTTSGTSTPSTSAPSVPTTGTLPTTRFDATLTGVGSGLCLSVNANRSAAGVTAVLASCQTLSGQTWSLAGVGATGVASTFAGAQCLDAWGGSGTPGTQVGTWTCVASAPNHQWTLTGEGYLKGQNGLCLGVRQGATASGTPVELQSCSGAAHQRWTAVQVASTAAPVPAPAPTTPSTSLPAGAEAVSSLMGPLPSASSVAARGGIWKRYEDEFAPYADLQWTASGADWYEGNYYDRAMIYYVWWARTGNATYLERASAMAVNYRDNYLVASNYGPSAYWAQMDGVALHYAVTGDERSRLAVGRVADGFASPSSLLYVGTSSMEQRDQARTLVGLLLAWKIQAPSAMGYDWASMLRTVLTKVLATQSADGAYRVDASQCGYNKPFMVGMLNDALIRYYEMFEQDPRILTAVQRSADYMWQNDWLAAQQAFVYLGGTCNSSFGSGDRTPAPDLNNMISSAYGWLGWKTGDAGYYTKGDAIFTGGVNGAYLNGSKQFNQEYTSSYRYLAYRF